MKIFVSHDIAEREVAITTIFALRDRGYDVVDPVDTQAGDEPLSTQMLVSDLVLVILGPAPGNARFDVGFATGIRKNILVASQSSDLVDPRLKAFPWVQLSPDALTASERIVHAVERYRIRKPDAVAAEQGDTAAVPEQYLLDVIKKWFESRGSNNVRSAVDSGPDIVANLPDGRLIAITVKQTRDRTPIDAVRSAAASGASVGAKETLLLTTAGLTRAAAEYASKERVLVRNVNRLLSAHSLAEVLSESAGPEPVEISSSPEVENARNVVLYEIEMLKYASSQIDGASSPQARNMALEVFLLHFRNLLEFFTDRFPPSLSIRRPAAWIERQPEESELKRIQEMAQPLYVRWWRDISHHLHHMSAARLSTKPNWPYREMRAELEPVISAFVDLLRHQQPTPASPS